MIVKKCTELTVFVKTSRLTGREPESMIKNQILNPDSGHIKKVDHTGIPPPKVLV